MNVLKQISMKKFTSTYIVILLLTVNVQAVKVKFTVANMSVNVAEGTIGIFTSFKLFPDDFENTDSLNVIDFIDFPFVSYNDITQVMIDKAMLSAESSPNFLRMANFVVTDSISSGSRVDNDILQGSTYVFRLTVMDNNGQEFQLLNRAITIQLADPTINCAKLNNVYRLAGHNTYQPSVVYKSDGGLYQSLFYTRVLELDIHRTSTPIAYEVFHTGFFCNSNCNNCGYNTLTGQADGDKTFIVCLADIKQWHIDYPNHDPIIIHIDLQDDFKVSSQHTPARLDQFFNDIFGETNIYKPRDLLGNNFGNMRAAAQLNNWPSMGDLTGKFIFVLTGDGAIVSEYIRQRSLSAIAFSAARVNNNNDVNDLTRSTPSIGIGLENDIVFYNMQHFNKIPLTFDDANLNTGFFTSNLNYINRTFGIGTFGQPGDYDPDEYAEAINFNMHNIAIGNIDDDFNPSNGRPINGIQWLPGVTFPGLVNNRIYSNYQNVTQAALNNIVATSLTVEPGTHYRMIAGNSVKLKPGVHFKAGSEVKVRIDDCRFTDYTQRQNTQTGEQLTQEEIDAIMHQLNKKLYGYQPESEEELVNLSVYPNPTNDIVNISYTNFLRNPSIFTIYDVTGRVVKTYTYNPPTEGKQNFSLNIAELKEGTYFYTLQVGEQTYNGKVVKINQ